MRDGVMKQQVGACAQAKRVPCGISHGGWPSGIGVYGIKLPSFSFRLKAQCEAAAVMVGAASVLGSHQHTFDGGRLTRLKES
jgi:hypothetical protein